jgi:glycerate 2-kinase
MEIIMNSLDNKERIIQNFDCLVSHGQQKARKDALKIVEAGIRGADPGVGTYNLVRLDGNTLLVGNKKLNLKAIEHIYVVGAGKGSFPIAEALENILGDLITEGIVVVKRGEKRRLQKIKIHEAGHPIPDQDSVEGARKIVAVVEKAGAKDLVFAAITGGSSSLVTLPVEGVSLKEMQDLTELLLKCGAVIREINIIRKHLCLMKGGRLVSYIQPAEAITLTLDTAPEGMPWPDMSLPDQSTFQDAVEVLKYYDLLEKVAPSIKRYLIEGRNKPELESIKTLEGMRTTIFSVGDPVRACESAARCAAQLGYNPAILSSNIEGEAKDIGICFAGIAKEIIKKKRPFLTPCALISGGETTVTIGEECGNGGPNQELVLGFAHKFKSDAEVVCVSVDTDGTDGPTEIAGGIVDSLTQQRAEETGVNIDYSIKNHNSLDALIRLEDALVTGQTGTNVMNLRVVVIR